MLVQSMDQKEHMGLTRSSLCAIVLAQSMDRKETGSLHFVLVQSTDQKAHMGLTRVGCLLVGLHFVLI